MQFIHELHIKTNEEFGRKAVSMLKEFIAGSGIEIRDQAEGDIAADVEFRRDPVMTRSSAGHYKLRASGGRVLLRYNDSEGARNAAVAIYRIIAVRTSSASPVVFDDCETEDWPDCQYRGVMIDPARVYIPLESVFSTIRQAALARMNKLNMHLCDSGRYAIESVRLPELNNQNLRRYNIGEIRQIIDYADLFGLEVVPHFDVPAHATHILDCYPALRCEIDDGTGYSSWAVCAAKEETYDFLEKALEELAEIFPSELVFLCGDELEFADLPEYDLRLNWQHCTHCKELSSKNGFNSNTDIFYHFIRRAHSVLNKHGKRMMLANDNIDISRTPEIPKDILIVYWRIAMEGSGPVEGCSMERFLEEGFELINMDYPEAYIDLYMTEEKLCDWSPVKRPYCSGKYHDQVFGSMICAWEGKKHYEWTLPSGIIMFGDKLWDFRDKIYDKSYYVEVLRRLLGPMTPPGLDVFSLLGACLLPLDEDSSRMGFPERISKESLPEIDETIRTLEGLIDGGLREKDTAAAYLKCLRWMKMQKAGEAQ